MGQFLTTAQISNYLSSGYHAPIQVFSAQEAAALRRSIETEEAARGPIFTEDRARPGDRFQGSYRFKSHLLFKWLADALRHPTILDAVEDLVGPDILCWTTHWFLKEAKAPQYVSWHQDSNYWGIETDRLVSVWLAVSASTLRSGCLRLLPGSHRTPPLTHVDTYAEDNMLTRGQTIMDIDESAAVNLELAPGQAALFDYGLAHASGPNESDDRRIGIGIRYMPTSARQSLSDWDCASLVRGEDRFSHFEHEPRPRCDFDPPAVAIQAKADEAQRKIYYRGAAPPQKASA